MQDFVKELVLFLDCGISLDSPSGKSVVEVTPETLITFEFTNVNQEDD